MIKAPGEIYKMVIYKKFLIVLIVLISLTFISAEEFGYNYLETSQNLNPPENFSKINVNSSQYWDNLDVPTDITNSEFWYNHTLETFNTWDGRWYQVLWDSVFNASFDQRDSTNADGSINSSSWNLSSTTIIQASPTYNLNISNGTDAGLFYDSANNRVGIRTSSPTGILDINDATGETIFLIQDAVIGSRTNRIALLDSANSGNTPSAAAAIQIREEYNTSGTRQTMAVLMDINADNTNLVQAGNYRVNLFATQTGDVKGQVPVISMASGTDSVVPEAWGTHSRILMSSGALGTFTKVYGVGTQLEAEDGNITTGYHYYAPASEEKGAGIFTTTASFWADKQTVADTNYGIVLNGDGSGGAGIWFGDSQNSQIYFDGINLIINPDEVGSGILEVNSNLNVTKNITVGTYMRHIDIETGQASTGSTAPTQEFIGTASCLTYNNDNEHSLIGFEVPQDWDGVSDMTLNVYWVPLTQMADTETVIWNATYRVKTPNVGEAIDGGATTSANVTYTQSGAGIAKELLRTSIIIDYNDASNPLVKNDKVMIQFNREFSIDTFGGDASVCQWHVELNSTTMPEN